MRRVRINGQTYAAPFGSLFHPLGPNERQTLVDGIILHGVLDPVHVYTSDLHGRAVIDGLNRAGIAESLGLDAVPLRDHGRLGDAEAERRARSLNADRRVLTPDEVAAHAAARAADRRERVAAARAEGKSLRAIAAAEGVSHEQVRRDVRRKTVTGGATASADSPEETLHRVRRALDRAIEGVAALAAGQLAADLFALAARHGVPLEAGGVWPAVSRVRAALADLAARAAGG